MKSKDRSVEYMPVSDALADAETLRRNPHFYSGMGFALSTVETLAVASAGNLGMNAAWLMWHTDDNARDIAVMAARAAFRAVPGLRGDK